MSDARDDSISAHFWPPFFEWREGLMKHCILCKCF